MLRFEELGSSLADRDPTAGFSTTRVSGAHLEISTSNQLLHHAGGRQLVHRALMPIFRAFVMLSCSVRPSLSNPATVSQAADPEPARNAFYNLMPTCRRRSERGRLLRFMGRVKVRDSTRNTYMHTTYVHGCMYVLMLLVYVCMYMHKWIDIHTHTYMRMSTFTVYVYHHIGLHISICVHMCGIRVCK